MQKVTRSKDCMRCRECCIFEKDEAYFAPLFTKEERKGLKKANFKKHKSRLMQVRLKKYKKKYACNFLNTKTWQCEIYLKRPFDCKIYPFLLMKNKEKDKVFLAHFHDACFSLMKNNKKQFQKHINRLKRLFSKKEYVDFLKKNKGLIWDYDQDALECTEIRALSSLLN